MTGIIGRVDETRETSDGTEVDVVFLFPKLSGEMMTVLRTRAKTRALAEAGVLNFSIMSEFLETVKPGRNFRIKDNLESKLEVRNVDVMQQPTSLGDPGKVKITVFVKG